MHVFQDQDQRVLRSQRFEHFADFPNHALGRRPRDFPLHGLPLLALDHRRELNQPGRSAIDQILKRRAALESSKQLSQGFEHGIVGFFSAETFHTLTANHMQFRTEGGPLMEHVNECCLADSGLARDERHLSLTLQ
jgi:hypothetical protein